MTQIYGHKWISSFGSGDDDHVWLAGLQGITPDEIKHGFKKLIDRNFIWPPTLPEFRMLCLGIDNEQEIVTKALMNVDCETTRYLQNKITSWDRSHLAETELKKRYQALVNDAVTHAIQQKMGEPERLRLSHEKS